ncbi:hypothetical protein ABZW11_17335 [Nonomuraea sp. NPDC004580]|uniref:hypothetical protein n=1 Tax=Nonomuraea sp. NPDC004580 TaxID=3154552 RepID=UPI0033B9BD08
MSAFLKLAVFGAVVGGGTLFGLWQAFAGNTAVAVLAAVATTVLSVATVAWLAHDPVEKSP